MTPADLLYLASSCMSACCSEPPDAESALMQERGRRSEAVKARRERRRHNGMPDETDDDAERILYGGPLWSVTLPVMKGLLPRLFEYAQNHELELFGIRGRLAALKAEPTGWIATVEGTGHGREGSVTGNLTYASNWEKDVATGQWMPCSYGKWRLTRVLPEIQAKPYGCDVKFGAEFVRPGWFSRLLSGSLEHIEVHANYARPIVNSRAKTFLLPDIRFVEQRPAVVVEGKR
jgi:hypothetical protein